MGVACQLRNHFSERQNLKRGAPDVWRKIRYRDATASLHTVDNSPAALGQSHAAGAVTDADERPCGNTRGSPHRRVGIPSGRASIFPPLRVLRPTELDQWSAGETLAASGPHAIGRTTKARAVRALKRDFDKQVCVTLGVVVFAASTLG
jgi:hypothetical protein